jgi:vacuolar protein sorting-associated protein 26
MFRFSNSARVDIDFTGAENRRTIEVRELTSEAKTKLPVYGGLDPVIGTVTLGDVKRCEYTGIKVELVGQVDLLNEKSSSFSVKDTVKFVQVVKELKATPGILFQKETHPFEFSLEKVHETYRGKSAALRYFVRVTISRNYSNGGNIVTDFDIAVQNSQPRTIMNDTPPEAGIKMEVGIEDCLHIEFEFDKQKYSLDDVVLGKVYFLLVRIKIKHMELAINRRESVGNASSGSSDSQNVTKFELMDGAPVKGEVIPVRLFLSDLELTPTYRSVANVFSVKYFLNLVLIDEEDRRYFKQQEITFWRAQDEPKTS